MTDPTPAPASATETYDAIIIGAGISGMYQLHRLRGLGLSAQDNVRLVDIRESPIVRITPTGIETRGGHHPADIIIYATGFDAVVGALNRIEVRGPGGRLLEDTWADGPRTYLGLQAEGFPNLFTLVGPHNARASATFRAASSRTSTG